VSLRTERIAQQLREEIARVLRDEVTDHRVKLITVLKVDVAPDLSNAIVYWSMFDRDGDPDLDSVDSIAQGLDSAAGFMRQKLAMSLSLRRMPALRFRYDASLRLAGETMEILQVIENGKEETQ
jgi:ribosome-binding factor A